MTSWSEHLKIDLSAPVPVPFSGHLKMGGKNPQGIEINANNRYLTFGGRPWLPVMGEFHYSRYPNQFWTEELLKMKAGGIEVVATYLFWIYHEEIEGQFDWTGDRDLRRFIQLCGEVGLYAYPRIGPWAHGEARNGGFPDWLVQACGEEVRRDAPLYLSYGRRFYAQAARQLSGLLWQEGGPVIGIQLENELADNPGHILTLKHMALEAGLQVPLYTMTGWGPARVPVDEVLPVFGGYPDAFWDRQTEDWSRPSRKNYFFSAIRDDNAIGADLLKRPDTFDLSFLERSPFATCELGGGMAIAYHRRPLIESEDVAAMALAKLGSGNNLLGYYMYHGGTQPDGRLSTMQESQLTGYWNDLPVKTYDFQAPLGEFGGLQPSYHTLRHIHLFTSEFGARLAPMPMTLPAQVPAGLDDRQTLRWAVRSDGSSGFIFINNYQRIETLPAHPAVRFELDLKDEILRIPSRPVEIGSGAFMIWPFNLDLDGFRLKYATAQPLCRVMDGEIACYVFSAVKGVSPEFAFSTEDSITFGGDHLHLTNQEGFSILNWDEPGGRRWINLKSPAGQGVRVLVLDESVGPTAWKAQMWGSERLFLSRASLAFDGETLRLESPEVEGLWFEVFPAPERDLTATSGVVERFMEGGFTRYAIQPAPRTVSVAYRRLGPAGPSRVVPLGSQGVAQAPEESDFERAETWEVRLPPDCLANGGEILLKIDYVGDAGRAYLGGKLVADHFYFGRPWEIGLKRFAPEVLEQGLVLKFLPLSQAAPVYLDSRVRPDFCGASEIFNLREIKAEVVYSGQLSPVARLPGNRK